MKPKAIIISDIHFTLQTLDLATKSLETAFKAAIDLDIPLIIAGDTLDNKAIIRAEISNRLLTIFDQNQHDVYMLVGNHDRINEKDYPHSLKFLENSGVYIIDDYCHITFLDMYFISYQPSQQTFLNHLQKIPKGSTIICHQGVQTAYMGHYIQDKTSLPKETFSDYRVISGHYHKRQDIKCGRPRRNAVGLFSYIGNPYTLNIGEANDGLKGYSILLENGLLQFVPLYLRKHIVIERSYKHLDQPIKQYEENDILLLKVKGPYSELQKLNKEEIGQKLIGNSNFRLEFVDTQEKMVKDSEQKCIKHTNEELLERFIEQTNETDEFKLYLKSLWKELV